MSARSRWSSVASGPPLGHCRGRSILRRSRLHFPCIWATHYKAEKCSRCMQSVARSGVARVSRVRASSLFTAGEAVCGRLCVVRSTCCELYLQRRMCAFIRFVRHVRGRWYDAEYARSIGGCYRIPKRPGQRTIWRDHWNVSACSVQEWCHLKSRI